MRGQDPPRFALTVTVPKARQASPSSRPRLGKRRTLTV